MIYPGLWTRRYSKLSILPFLPDQLCQLDDPELLNFKVPEWVEELSHFIGQPRAVEAVLFGTGFRTQP